MFHLFVDTIGMKTLEIPFTCSQGTQQKCEATLCPTRVCGDRLETKVLKMHLSKCPRC